MADNNNEPPANAPAPAPTLVVSPGPHLHQPASSTRRMMGDVLIGLLPLVLAALFVFRQYALLQLAICIPACLAAEALFNRMRARSARSLLDGSAAVTGTILALSLPATAPWYVGLIGSCAAIGFGKAIFGGLGQNIFNPAMVGRAFVMIAFASVMGASAYVLPGSAVDALTQATPLTALKQTGAIPPLGPLFLGLCNGSLGETSALAALIGGLYLCWRRAAAWQIPAGVVLAAGLIALLGQLAGVLPGWTVAHEFSAGALLFGAFFIATDPVSSPLTARGRWIFGLGLGALVMALRRLSGYPEGMMFAVLLMNAVTPLINRWTVPVPVGGPVPERKA